MSEEMMQVCGSVNREWKVLIVDHDLNCLMKLEEMLQYYNFKVTKCQYAKEAISLLQQDRNRFDVVVTDLNTPDMDEFGLLKRIGLEMNLLVIMLLADDDDEHLMRKGLIYGACDYLRKPILTEDVEHLWKYVYLKQRHDGLINGVEQSVRSSSFDIVNVNESNSISGNYSQNINTNISEIASVVAVTREDEANGKCMKKRKYASNFGTQVKDDATTKKKQRVIWTAELHAKFVAAVNQCETTKAVPKKILELMNVPGLTRENVASHLQKYRLYCKRLGQTPQYQSEGMNVMFPSKESISEIELKSHQPECVYTSTYENNEQTTSEMNTNSRVSNNEVEGCNVIYQPVTSYAYQASDARFHLVGTPWSPLYLEDNVKSEVCLDTVICGGTTSTRGQPYSYKDVSQTTYENHMLGYSDAALYFGQLEQTYMLLNDLPSAD